MEYKFYILYTFCTEKPSNFPLRIFRQTNKLVVQHILNDHLRMVFAEYLNN